ncbi:ERF family protein [soil metagenome]
MESHIAPSSYRSAELKDLFTALAKAQSEMQTAGLSAENPYFKTRYADLAAIVKASRPALTKYGLSIIQQIITSDEGHTYLHTLLCHISGQWVESRVRVVPTKTDVQSMGSYITYLRRYSIAALCGIVTSDEDDDGNLAATAYVPAIKTTQSTYISTHELATLEAEIASRPDIGQLIKDGLQIASLALIPKTKYSATMQRIKTIKAQ